MSFEENTTLINDIDETTNDMTQIVNDQCTLGRVVEVLERNPDQELSQEAVKIIDIQLESICNRIGIKRKNPSLESYTGSYRRVAVEQTKSLFDRIGDVISAIIKWLREAFSNFMSMFKSKETQEKLKTATVKIEKAQEVVKKKPDRRITVTMPKHLADFAMGSADGSGRQNVNRKYVAKLDIVKDLSRDYEAYFHQVMKGLEGDATATSQLVDLLMMKTDFKTWMDKCMPNMQRIYEDTLKDPQRKDGLFVSLYSVFSLYIEDNGQPRMEVHMRPKDNEPIEAVVMESHLQSALDMAEDLGSYTKGLETMVNGIIKYADETMSKAKSIKNKSHEVESTQESRDAAAKLSESITVVLTFLSNMAKALMKEHKSICDDVVRLSNALVSATSVTDIDPA